MSRRQSVAILVVCAALVIGPAVALAGGAVLGAWKPAGPQAAATPGSPQPAFPGIETTGYGEFLDDVRGGRVVNVFQAGLDLSVATVDSGYQVRVPDPSVDVLGDIEQAAEDSGQPPPSYANESGPAEPQPMAYEEMLAEVSAGRVFDVFHHGDTLELTTGTRGFTVAVPPGATDVLADIEAAAASGEVAPPAYTKVPG